MILENFDKYLLIRALIVYFVDLLSGLHCSWTWQESWAVQGVGAWCGALCMGGSGVISCDEGLGRCCDGCSPHFMAS